MLIPRRSCPGAATAALAALALAIGTGACRKQEEARPAPSSSEQRYTFRAEVVKLPVATHARPQITLRHEAIPDFRDQSGAVVGMAAMVMPFELAPSASADGVTAGDKVEVILVADWTRPSFRIERLTRLPRDTVLALEPEAATTPPGPAVRRDAREGPRASVPVE